MLASMPGGQTDRVGAFSPVVLTRILKRTADEGRSGALQVACGPSVKTVHFDHGSVRFAASNIRRDRLGESMLAHEFISKEDYARAVAKMKSERCRFGEALVSLGRLTQEEVHRELAIQVQRIVLSLFRIPAGMYSYDDAAGGTSISTALPFALPLPPLMLKGLRAIDDGKLILSGLPPATTRVRLAPNPPRGVPVKKLSDDERCVLQIAGEGTEIGEIVRRSGLVRSSAFRACFILLSMGLLEAIPDDISPAVEASPGDPARSELAAEIEPCGDLIVSQFDKLTMVSERDLLGIRADATREQAVEAYEELRAEWAEVRNQTKDPDLVDKVDAIELQLATAYARVKLELDKALEKPAPPPVDFARRERIEQLARDARLHVQVKDWNGAIPLLHELVALEPKQAEFQALLGKSLKHVPSMRKNAEQHLLEAVTLAPNDVSLRLELARFHLTCSNRSRARVEIQSVLAMDPGNEEAHRLAASLKEPTPMQKLFSKVFR
jgi:Flp pilus assembly protein TadD